MLFPIAAQKRKISSAIGPTRTYGHVRAGAAFAVAATTWRCGPGARSWPNAESRFDFPQMLCASPDHDRRRHDRDFDSKARTGVWHDRRNRNSSLGSSIGVDDPSETDEEDTFQ